MTETRILYMLVEYEDNTHIISEIINLNHLSDFIKNNQDKLIKIHEIERDMASFLEEECIVDSRKAWDE